MPLPALWPSVGEARLPPSKAVPGLQANPLGSTVGLGESQEKGKVKNSSAKSGGSRKPVSGMSGRRTTCPRAATTCATGERPAPTVRGADVRRRQAERIWAVSAGAYRAGAGNGSTLVRVRYPETITQDLAIESGGSTTGKSGRNGDSSGFGRAIGRRGRVAEPAIRGSRAWLAPASRPASGGAQSCGR